VFSGGTGMINNVRVTFNEAVTPSTFTGADVSMKLNGNALNLTYTVTPVSGSGNKQFDIAFANQTALGTYAMTIGPTVLDSNNYPMNQDGDAINGEVPADQYVATGVVSGSTTFSNNNPTFLPDVRTTTSTISVPQSLTIAKLTVKMHITHTWDSDLKVTLRSPAGTTITLVHRRGGSGDNFNSTVFDSAATTSITAGIAPFAGTYRPEGTLTAFNNQNASGVWTLSVQDRAAADVGTLQSWSITVTPTEGGSAVGDGDGAGSFAELDSSFGVKLGMPRPLLVEALQPLTQLSAPASSTPVRSEVESNPLFQNSEPHENPLFESIAADAGFVEVGTETEEVEDDADWLDFDAEVESELIAV
jgi:subtilisin-like proprotein convertase family protein